MMVLQHQNETKRSRESEDSEHSPSESYAKKTRHEPSSMMDSKELASAVALASLASFSPTTTNGKPTRTGHAENHETTALESRSPKAEPIPVSPDARSPMRSIKRVHFASHAQANQAEQSAGRYEFQPVGPPTPQPHSFPVGVPPPPPPPGFGIFPAMARHQPPPHWMQARIPPPQRIIQQPFGPRALHWICDFCNAAAFKTYEEACVHEEACKTHCHQTNSEVSRPPLIFNSMAGGGNAIEGESGTHTPGTAASGTEWFRGSISLAIPESDSEWLSEINCFVRKFCVEAFSATEEDILSTSKRGRITLHQVGIRCRYCKHRPLKERAVAAVSYPTSVAGVYESVKRFLRLHLEICNEIPEEVRTNMSELQNHNVWIPTTRQYWTDSARALGMVDTEEGIRFSCDPKFIQEANKLDAAETSSAAICGKKSDSQVLADGDYIVFSEDMRIVPPYVYFLMRQVESCHFSEVDRFVARSKGPVGYPGFQCRHCSGHAGLGKYFPVSAKTLSTNSTSQNIHAHLLKCRKCPDHIKEKLVTLKVEKGRSPRLEPGWRKIFFDKVWHRLHG